MKSKLLLSSGELTTEFARLCKEYHDLDMAVAWCGDPSKILPFSYLNGIDGNIRVVLGTSFLQTHPMAIRQLLNLATILKVTGEEKPLFHPKLYIFSNGDARALIIGSSNFTYSGFCANYEANILIEGSLADLRAIGLERLMLEFEKWISDNYSFVPSEEWIYEYHNRWENARKTERNTSIKTPALQDADIPSGSWLSIVDWPTFLDRLKKGLENNERSIEGYFKVLDEASDKLSIPWKIDLFNDINNRRIILGTKSECAGELGWLGRVAASGDFCRLIKNGTPEEKEIIVNAMNEVALMIPIQWDRMYDLLNMLTSLGPTIKVWGRLLCLVRPDMFCSISSNSLRKNLAKTLNKKHTEFEKPEGYIELVKLLHRSPWFNSSEPDKEDEKRIWKYRVALIDPIFY